MAVAIDSVTQSAARKVAVLLVSLGEELAAPLLRNLREEQIEAITREIVALERISERDKRDVFERCHQDLWARQVSGTPAGSGFARDLLARSLGTKKAQDLLSRVGTSSRAEAFDFVKQTDLGQILSYFEGEHPQTIALALAHMPPELAGQILSGLSYEMQADVAIRVAHTSRTDPEIVRGVEETMRRNLQFCTTEGTRSVGGMPFLVDVLNACDSRSERAIMEAIHEVDPELAQELRDRMFTFEDLATLDDRSMQRLLREIDNRDLAVALRGSPEDVCDRVFRNLSSRVGIALREEIERLGPVRLRLVEEAQQKIVAIARRLHEEEEVVLPRGRQDVFV